MRARLPAQGLSLGLLAVFVLIGCAGAYVAFGQQLETAYWELVASAQPSTRQESPPMPASTGATRLLPSSSLEVAPAPPKAASTAASLSKELESYVAGLDGTYGVAVRNLTDGQRVLIDADRVFPAASLYKLLVMYRVYQLIEQGKLSSNSKVTFESGDFLEGEDEDGASTGDVVTVGEAVESMITYSSNPAAYALARTVGGWDEVTAAASELGMRNTKYNGQYYVSTPADMLHFFELLGTRSLLSPIASAEMIAVLARQRINDRIPIDLPPGTKVAHKTGELPKVRNDAGIVFTDNGPYAIAIMSEGIDPPKAAQAQARISRIVFDRLGTRTRG